MNVTSLSELLERVSPPGEVVPPNLTVIRRTIDGILDDHGRRSPRTRDPEQMLSEMQRRMAENDWQGVPLSFAMEVGELAFAPEFRARDDLAEIRQFYLDEILASDRPGFLGAMIRIYIETFDAVGDHTRRLAAALRQVIHRIGAQWRKVLDHFPDLFDPSKAVQQVAEFMASAQDIWADLRVAGLRQPHAPGLMSEAHHAFLELVGPRLKERVEVERVLAWLKPEGEAAMSHGAADAIAALLRPWRGDNIPPEVKQLLLDRLLELYGHPKVSRNAIWNQVPDDLEGLFLHWLTGADIRMLFRVLTEVERGHMWEEREKFWLSLYNENRIDEVWVAFNPDGYRAAMAKLPRDQRQDQANVRFALQEGEKDKSLLIMRIGKYVAIEGTYNFKVHIFDAQAANAPKLYQRRYDVADIRRRRGANAFPHLGNWQAKARDGLGLTDAH